MFDIPKAIEAQKQPSREVLNAHYKTLFPEYDWQPHKDYLSLAKEACWIYDDIINKREKRWLSTLGHSGTGKTEWSKRIRTALKKQGFNVQLWDWSTVCESYLNKSDYGILDHLQKREVLIIDEIGKTDWKTGNSKLTHLIERRLGKWTICISNMDQGDIAEKIDTRIASRMARGLNRIVTMGRDCPDYDNLKRGQS